MSIRDAVIERCLDEGTNACHKNGGGHDVPTP